MFFVCLTIQLWLHTTTINANNAEQWIWKYSLSSELCRKHKFQNYIIIIICKKEGAESFF